MYLAESKPDDYGARCYMMFQTRKQIKSWEHEAYRIHELSNNDVAALLKLDIADIYDECLPTIK